MGIWVNHEVKLPIYTWIENIEEQARQQADNLANHPCAFHHVALMPDCHMGFGMPIGGVAAFEGAVLPNAVGVDIGCGMAAVKTDFLSHKITRNQIEKIRQHLLTNIPVGFAVHSRREDWDGFHEYIETTVLPEWFTDEIWARATKSLGTLGGGNHFIEIQEGDDRNIWLMLHSGSRNLGAKIAEYYNKTAQKLNEKWHSPIPSKDLAFLPVDSMEGVCYLRDMNFALAFAQENRSRMMKIFKEAVELSLGSVTFGDVINIHHNYASLENHFGRNVWVHRKGATSAKKGQMGVIPGSMGSPSYIVEGKGNRDSFMSCSHGAGRKMSRTKASESLSVDQCNKDMKGIVFGGWSRGKKGGYDLSESPRAYKDIDTVIQAQLDLISPLVKLKPLGVVKG